MSLRRAAMWLICLIATALTGCASLNGQPASQLPPYIIAPERVSGLETSESFRTGMEMARQDLAAGKLMFREYGLPVYESRRAARRAERRQQALKKYGIEIFQTCEMDGWGSAYNHFMGLEVIERYGPSFWARIPPR